MCPRSPSKDEVALAATRCPPCGRGQNFDASAAVTATLRDELRRTATLRDSNAMPMNAVATLPNYGGRQVTADCGHQLQRHEDPQHINLEDTAIEAKAPEPVRETVPYVAAPSKGPRVPRSPRSRLLEGLDENAPAVQAFRTQPHRRDKSQDHHRHGWSHEQSNTPERQPEIGIEGRISRYISKGEHTEQPDRHAGPKQPPGQRILGSSSDGRARRAGSSHRATASSRPAGGSDRRRARDLEDL